MVRRKNAWLLLAALCAAMINMVAPFHLLPTHLATSQQQFPSPSLRPIVGGNRLRGAQKVMRVE